MPDTPNNGKQRFEDLREQVCSIDSKVDKHGESLARIETMLNERPCIIHDKAISDHAARLLVIEQGANIRVGRMAAVSGVIAAAVAAIGAWLTHN